MELRRALTIFRIQKRIPIEDLNSVFRELVKKYHPEWAHERRSEINDAYETLAEWLSKPPPQKKPAAKTAKSKAEPQYDGSTDRDQPQNSDDELFRRESPPLSPRAAEELYPRFNLFLDGLGVYYQYGLDNPAYRAEGVRRFR